MRQRVTARGTMPCALVANRVNVAAAFVVAFCLFLPRSTEAQAPEVLEGDQVETLDVEELSEGVQLLDKALAAKMNARRMSDLTKVIQLCEKSIEAGLEQSDQDFANELLASCHYEMAKRLVQTLAGGRVNLASYTRRRKAAMDALHSAIQADPDNGEAYLLLGQIQELPGGDVDSGRESVEKAVELLRANPVRRSVAWSTLATFTDDIDEKKKHLQSAVEVDPQNLDAWRALGRAHLQSGDYQAALEKFIYLAKKDPEDNDSLDIASKLLLAEEKYDEALELMDDLLKKAPNSQGIYTLRANVYAMQNQLERASKDLEKALELKPNDTTALLARSRLLFVAGDDEEAMADINRVLELSPGLPEAYALRSDIAQTIGNFRQAISDLRQLLKLDPNNKKWLSAIANIYLADQRPTMAIDTFDQILQQDPTNWAALKGRANALLTIGKHQKAIQAYETVVQKLPKDSESLNNLAWVLATSTEEDLRDGERAIELAQKACELTEYKAAHILSTLAAGYAEIGKFDEARDWSTKAVNLGEGEIKTQLKEELQSYQSNKPWRERQQVEPDEDDLGLSSDLDIDDE